MDAQERRKEALKRTQEALAEQENDDQLLIQQIRALDELQDLHNQLQERVQAWKQYGENAQLEELEKAATAVQTCLGVLESACIADAEALMPNVHAVLGDLLDCRILSLAGSLEKLAKMPSSTIQVLGAEKAMFRFMRGKGKMPKHGLLFMHPHVHSLPEKLRGKMARFLANKTALAAKIDFYDGDFKGEEFQQEIEARYEELAE